MVTAEKPVDLRPPGEPTERNGDEQNPAKGTAGWSAG